MAMRVCYGAAGLLLAALLATAGVCWPALATSASGLDLVLSNEYIAVIVNARYENTGRFALRTTGGDPDRLSDNDADLIYQLEDAKGPWTSFTTLLIDGDSWVYGGHTRDSAGYGARYGEPTRLPAIVDGKSSVSSWQLGPIHVTQTISFVRSSTTGLMDTARIVYELHNSDGLPHEVGVRVALDTMLGDNDGAPFRVGDQAITTDTAYSGAAIPEFWQAFDSLEDPKVTAQGTLRGGEVTRPDKVFFTNWGTLSQEPWKIDFVPGRDFTRAGGFELDSAVALLWEPALLGAGERKSLVIYFGSGGITIAPGQLQLGVTSPARVVGGDAAESFPIIAYVQNRGTGEARDLQATISLPPGLRLAPGQSARRVLGSLPVGQTAQVSWRALASEGAGTLTFSVGVTAMNADPNTVTRSIEVVAPARLKVTLEGAPSKAAGERGAVVPLPYPIDVSITNVGESVAAGVQAEWSSSRGLQLAAGDTGRRHIGSLHPGETCTVRWQLRPTGEVGDLPFKVQATLAAAQGGAVASGLVRVPPLEASIQMKVERQRPQDTGAIAVGEMFLVYIDAHNLKMADSIQLEAVYDPTRVELLGGVLGVDRGTLFVKANQEYLGWERPRVWVDVSKPLARVAVAGNRSNAGEQQPVLSGSVAVLRLQALGPGDTDLRIDKVTVRDRYGQELLVATTNARVSIAP